MPLLTCLFSALLTALAAVAQPAPETPRDTAPPPAAVPAPDPDKTMTTQAAVQPPPKVLPGAPTDLYADSDALLTALESAGDQIRTLKADLLHINRKSELEAGQIVLKRGSIMFQNEPSAPASATPLSADGKPAPPAPRPPRAPRTGKLFQIDFTEVEFNAQRHDESQSFVFDGEWLVEKQPANKQMFKYRVVPPGQKTDPLALGEGPFPMPIGQKKSKILDRFWATLMPPADGFPQLPDKDGNPFPVPDWVAKDTVQVRLIPRPESAESRDFREIRLWYTRDGLRPRVANTLKQDDSSDSILLTNTVVNQPLPAGAFDTSDLPGWDVQIEEFRQAKADK